MIVNVVEGINLDARPPAGLLRGEVLGGAALDGGVVGAVGELSLLTVGEVSVIRAPGEHRGAGGALAEPVLLLRLADPLAADVDPDPPLHLRGGGDHQLVLLVCVGVPHVG